MLKFGKINSSFMAVLFALSFVFAPLYVWRFSIGGLPTNFLMLFLFVVIAIGGLGVLLQRDLGKLRNTILSLGKPVLVSITVFVFATLVSLVAFGITTDKISQWVVLYLQPILMFLLIRYYAVSVEDNKILDYLKIAAYIFVGAAGLLALIQYFTLYTLPIGWWGNSEEPKRAIAFFAHPNAFGLFVTPVLAWLIPDLVEKIRDYKNYLLNILPLLLWVLGSIGILLSLSRGAWLGLIAAFAVYALVNASKKLLLIFAGLLIVIASVIAVVPNLRYRVLLPFHGEKSSVARFSLWNTGAAMITDNPILGKGVNGFKNNWDKFNTDTGLEHYNFPHNIFLNFWIDTGLLGLVSMMFLLGLCVVRGMQQRKTAMAVALLLFVVAMVVHGLIDIPYFKNDLALVFWMILALCI